MCLEGVWRVFESFLWIFGRFLESVWRVDVQMVLEEEMEGTWRQSKGCLEDFWMVSVSCLEGFWMVFGMCLEGVRRVFHDFLPNIEAFVLQFTPSGP